MYFFLHREVLPTKETKITSKVKTIHIQNPVI